MGQKVKLFSRSFNGLANSVRRTPSKPSKRHENDYHTSIISRDHFQEPFNIRICDGTNAGKLPSYVVFV